jgi:hypothetical protein
MMVLWIVAALFLVVFIVGSLVSQDNCACGTGDGAAEASKPPGYVGVGT